MPNLSQLVKKIKSVQATTKITESLKIVSSNKFMIYKDLSRKSLVYTKGIGKLFYEFYSSYEHNFLETNKRLIRHTYGGNLWVIIGSDIGLCGDFNNKISAYLLKNIEKNDKVIVLGKKLFNVLKNHLQDKIIDNFGSEINVNNIPTIISNITRTSLQKFNEHKCGKLSIIYLKDVQAGIIEKINALPFTKNYFHKSARKPKNVIVKLFDFKVNYPDIIYEIFPKYLETLFCSAIICSKVSEHNFRKDLMYSATKNANELLDEYKITYNKLRQSIITQEISEIVAAVQVKKN